MPALEVGKTHTLRAEIVGDELLAWIDGKLLWQGRLPDEPRAIIAARPACAPTTSSSTSSSSPPRTSSGRAPACKREHERLAPRLDPMYDEGDG